eukprot:Sspe_Gene.39417::Locus_19011_Transcript_3_4_Confidence_0.182_Length_1450::g.39417::m.39417
MVQLTPTPPRPAPYTFPRKVPSWALPLPNLHPLRGGEAATPPPQPPPASPPYSAPTAPPRAPSQESAESLRDEQHSAQLAARARRAVQRQYMQGWTELVEEEGKAWASLARTLVIPPDTPRKGATGRRGVATYIRAFSDEERSAARTIQYWYRKYHAGCYGIRALRVALFHLRQEEAKSRVRGVQREIEMVRRELEAAESHNVEQIHAGIRSRLTDECLRDRANIEAIEARERAGLQAKHVWEAANFELVLLLEVLEDQEVFERSLIDDDWYDNYLDIVDSEHFASLTITGPCRQAVSRISTWWLKCKEGFYGRAGFRRRLAFDLSVSRELSLRDHKREIGGYILTSQVELLEAMDEEGRQEMLQKVEGDHARRIRNEAQWLRISQTRVVRLQKSLVGSDEQAVIPLVPVHPPSSQLRLPPLPPPSVVGTEGDSSRATSVTSRFPHV